MAYETILYRLTRRYEEEITPWPTRALVILLPSTDPRRPAPVLKKKRLAFRWYGGKFSHLDWLLPLLPVEGVHHYCEPFGGSAAVLLNRPPAPIETYNDLDGEVVNFFRVLRDQRGELIEALRLTPFSREEFELACSPPEENISDLERARRFSFEPVKCGRDSRRRRP